MENIQKRLDAAGKKTALTSIIVGLILILGGVVVNKLEPNSSSSSNKSNSNSYVTLSLENSRTVYPSDGDYAYCNYYSTSSATYYVHVTNGSLSSMWDDDGYSASYEYYGEYGGAKVYSFYADSYETYELTIYIYGYSAEVKVSSYSN